MAANKKMNMLQQSAKLLRGLGVVVILLAIVLALTLFFKLTKVEIVGTDSITAEELCAAVGIEIGDNLLAVNKNEVADLIFENFIVQVEKVSVTRKLPNRLVISIKEREPAAYMTTSGRRWVIDTNGIVMWTALSKETEGLIEIRGLSPLAPVAGEKAVVGEDDARRLSYVISLLTMLREQGMIDDVGVLDATDVSDFEFEYKDRFTVRLGSSAELEYKLSAIEPIIETLSSSDRGTIDVSGGSEKRKYFRPE